MAKKVSEERDPKSKEPKPDAEEHATSEGSASRTLGNQAKEAAEKVYRMARNTKRDTIAYLILAVGLVLLPWLPYWGAALIGLVVGAYFATAIFGWVKSIRSLVQEHGPARSIVIGGAILGLAIVLPTFLLGTAAAVIAVTLFTQATSNH